MSKEKFNIEKAEKLRDMYHEKRHYAKERFLNELIGYQLFFGDTSIVDCNLDLCYHYQRKTAETVLKELGYTLTTFVTIPESYIYDSKKPFSAICFI